MKAAFNNRMVETGDLCLEWNNRAFLYGDGLFETMIYKDGSINYLDRHLNRLHQGMEVLGLIYNDALNMSNVEEQVKHLIQINKLSGAARIKLQVWRKSGGLFTPLNNEIDFFISVQEHLLQPPKSIKAKISQEVKIHYSSFSRFKTCNMLPYILAGLEKKKKEVDEIIILNEQGYVAECSAANIFWVKDGIYFTPGIESGCIEGIKRGVIRDELLIKKIPFKEVLEGPDALYNADCVFACNVKGIYPLAKVGSFIYDYQVDTFLFSL